MDRQIIFKLSERPGVKALAVENFLFSIDMTIPKPIHLENAIRDQRLYNWNMATLSAIVDGIETAYQKTPEKP